jgi:hypothetical protein
MGRPAPMLDDSGLSKKGTESVDVAAQYSGTLGKIGNCQVVISAEYLADDPAIGTARVTLAYRLALRAGYSLNARCHCLSILPLSPMRRRHWTTQQERRKPNRRKKM